MLGIYWLKSYGVSRWYQRIRIGCYALLATVLIVFAGGVHAKNKNDDVMRPQVLFVTNQGEFVIEFYPDKVPETVQNFLQYVENGHYDRTIFHRVIAGFMIQGGGFNEKYMQKPTRKPVMHEGHRALAAGLRNQTGSVAMARTADPQSASAQFFINVNDNAFLDPVRIPAGDPVPSFQYQGRVYKNVPRQTLLQSPALYGYTVFGKIVRGMDVVQKISKMPTGAGGSFSSDVPRQQVLIESARKIR